MSLISEGIKMNMSLFNTECGVSYKITQACFVRSDVRVFAETYNSYQDTSLALTPGYRFKGGEKAE